MQILQTLTSIATASAVLINVLGFNPSTNTHKLAEKTMPMQDRYPADKAVNEVFKDNILLTLAYMEKKITRPEAIDWNEIDKPTLYELKLNPNEVFAFHDDVLSEFKNKASKTTNAHFNYQEGFKSDGFLFGDGVCHLASLMYWTAKEAKLEAVAPTNHDFHVIPDIPREFGVSIYSVPGETGTNSAQNLYIKNTNDKPVVFQFAYNGDALKLTVFSVN